MQDIQLVARVVLSVNKEIRLPVFGYRNRKQQTTKSLKFQDAD